MKYGTRSGDGEGNFQQKLLQMRMERNTKMATANVDSFQNSEKFNRYFKFAFCSKFLYYSPSLGDILQSNFAVAIYLIK